MYDIKKRPLGIYEKALPNDFTWLEKMQAAKQAGFDYIEISIDESLGEGFCIGHSYFCNLQPDTIDDSWLYGVVEYELIPLLKEYWFDEPMKVKDWSENLRSTIK